METSPEPETLAMLYTLVSNRVHEAPLLFAIIAAVSPPPPVMVASLPQLVIVTVPPPFASAIKPAVLLPLLFTLPFRIRF